MQSVSWYCVTVGFAVSLMVLPDLTGSGAAAAQRQPSEETSSAGEITAAAAPTPAPPGLPQDFPRQGDFVAVDSSIRYTSPVERTALPWRDGLAKLSVIIVATLFWLRALYLCTSEQNDLEAADAEECASCPQTLFLIGFSGNLIALLLPALLPGICLLLVTTLGPFWRYKRWRNRRLTDGTAALSWKHLFVRPVRIRRPDRALQVELPSGEKIGSGSSVISLIGKSTVAAGSQTTRPRRTRSSPGFQLVLALIDHAVSHRATDLHINTKDDQVTVRERIDGRLVFLGEVPLESGMSAINVFKVLGDLNIADRRRSQDGSFRADVNDRRLSFRVSSQGTQMGEKLSVRILDPAKTFSNLATLGMPPRIQQRFTAALTRHNGLILIVGATGAGKSTTACAALQSIDSTECNVITIEDPIEYQIASADQIEVNHRAGQTFQSALRGVLRQDPDVIFIGEIRDEETAKIACQAAMTGQLVLATLHANDAVSGAVRLAELGVDLHNVASALRAVLSQTLVRKLCTDCRIPYTPSAEERQQAGLQDTDEQLYRSPDPVVTACESCNDRGFLRRTGVFELLEITPHIRDLIRDKVPAREIMAAARQNGLSTLREEGLRLVSEGTISVDELHRIFDPV